MPDLDAFDVLVERSTTPEVSPEKRDQILASRADVVKVRDAAIAALDEAIHAWVESNGDAAVAATARAAVVRAEGLGITVNRAELTEMGLFERVPVPDLDAVPEEEPPAPTPEVTSDLDPLSVTQPGMVPVYNPTPHIIDFAYSGSFWPLRPNAVSAVHERAVDAAIGIENTGGKYMKYGVRRLYAAEPRFADAAARCGLSIEDFVRRRNAGLIFMADGVWARAAKKVQSPDEVD